MSNELFLKKILPSIIGLVLVVLGAMWLYGYVGLKTGHIGPTEVQGLNAISHHGAETAGGVPEAVRIKTKTIVDNMEKKAKSVFGQ